MFRSQAPGSSNRVRKVTQANRKKWLLVRIVSEKSSRQVIRSAVAAQASSSNTLRVLCWFRDVSSVYGLSVCLSAQMVYSKVMCIMIVTCKPLVNLLIYHSKTLLFILRQSRCSGNQSILESSKMETKCRSLTFRNTWTSTMVISRYRLIVICLLKFKGWLRILSELWRRILIWAALRTALRSLVMTLCWTQILKCTWFPWKRTLT